MHTHTTESDGVFTPAETIDMYHEEGFDILALTDHDSHKEVHITTYPWTDFDRDPEALGMVDVEGNELTGIYQHMLSLFNDFGGGSPYDFDEHLDEVGDKGGIAIYAHPTGHTRRHRHADRERHYYRYFAEIMPRPFIIGVEIENPRYGNAEWIWDALLTRFAPGRFLWGFANDDMHNIDEFNANRMYFLLPEQAELNHENVKNACQTGSFYCINGDGPLITNIDVTSNTINITSADADKISWISQGKVVATGNSIDLTETRVSRYVRALIQKDLGELNEQGEYSRTYTQPFFTKILLG